MRILPRVAAPRCLQFVSTNRHQKRCLAPKRLAVGQSRDADGKWPASELRGINRIVAVSKPEILRSDLSHPSPEGQRLSVGHLDAHRLLITTNLNLKQTGGKTNKQTNKQPSSGGRAGADWGIKRGCVLQRVVMAAALDTETFLVQSRWKMLFQADGAHFDRDQFRWIHTGEIRQMLRKNKTKSNNLTTKQTDASVR